ncbi:MAG TPA: ADOP family duplicated permease [Permianibacter sp.]|nr:ADOP family duplicated permease [Permianibacter sp.]
MWREIRYALRLLGKTPGFTALTLFVLAAGLCVAVYMHAFVRTLGYAELPFPDHDRLMMVGAEINGKEISGNAINGFDFQQLATGQQHFDRFFQSRSDAATLVDGEWPKRLRTNLSNSQLFDVTAVPALLGRVLQPADSAPGAAPVAVLSYALWQDTFNADPNVIGRTITLNDTPTQVVGVMPAGFAFPNWTDAWLPLPDTPALQPGAGPDAGIIGRLRVGSERHDAEAELKMIASQLEQQFPATNADRNVVVWPFVQQHITSGGMSVLMVMASAAAFILLLVMLNAGNLLLARAAERQKEIAIRSALGAPRLTLVRQMLWQALLLTMAGGLIGLFFASWSLGWNNQELAGFITHLPFWWRFELTGADLRFAFGLILLTGIAVGLYPALRASAGDLNQFLRDGTRGSSGLRMKRLTDVLVMAEIALSVALLIVALMLSISTYSKVNIDFRARIDNVLIANLSLPATRYPLTAHQTFRDQLEAGMQAQHGVQQVAFASHLPGMFGVEESYLIEGQQVTDERYPSVQRVIVSDRYFAAFDISLLQGRVFDHRDNSGDPVVIVSKQFADRHWPQQSALGKRLQLPLASTTEPGESVLSSPSPAALRWYTVIGVVDDALYQQDNMAQPDYSALYFSQRQRPTSELLVAVATTDAPMTLARTLASEVSRLDTRLPIDNVMPLAERIYRYTSNAGLVWITKQFLAMAALGVLLAASGIYGVIARSVALRTQELGVRRALGASEQRILAMLMRQGGWRFAIGGGVGLALGVLLMHAMRYAMFGLDGKATAVALTVLLLVGGIVGLATFWPARKAIALSPAAALRHD